ncbi:MAG: tetratricopeptide repeat protein, partial [Clostridiales bacterium]|nr:tetratricopeptide repeat protein [Clostridiales bacterium]
NSLGDLARKDGDLQAARDWHEKSLFIAEQLAKTRGTLEDQRDLSISYNKMGNLALEEGNWQAAREWCAKDLAIAERLVKTRGTVNDFDDLAVSLFRLATISDTQQERLHLAQRGYFIAEVLYKQTGASRYQSFMDTFHNLLK